MTTDTTYSPECPICGAPLSLKRVDRGSVICGYCGASVVLGSLPELAADPDRLKSIEEQALPPTIFAKVVRRYFPLPAGLLAGLSLVGTWTVFRRWPVQETAIGWSIAAAIATLFALAYKRRLYAILLSFAAGGLVFLKPFLNPADSDGTPFSPVSDTGFGFLVPGALLVAIGIIAALRIRPARFETDLGLLKPSILASIGLAVGIGLGALATSQPTNRDLLARYSAHLDARRQQYAAIATWIDAPNRPALPATAAGLNPPPVFIESSPASNVDFSPVEWMHLRPYAPAKELHIGSALSRAFERRRWIDDRDAWGYDDRLADLILPTAAATRYVVAYRCKEGTDDYPIFGCSAWMFSLDSSAPLLQIELTDSYRSFTEAGDALFAKLAAATGGTFQPPPL
ncbi:MAG: hypothetical protein M0R80_28930 [Proteobacteria bacterium]|jgi:hypothetical protein|nr:hypothetical protein [Pseudomonadota bacterium]